MAESPTFKENMGTAAARRFQGIIWYSKRVVTGLDFGTVAFPIVLVMFARRDQGSIFLPIQIPPYERQLVPCVDHLLLIISTLHLLSPKSESQKKNKKIKKPRLAV